LRRQTLDSAKQRDHNDQQEFTDWFHIPSISRPLIPFWQKAEFA
jgi:hypothetical protein